MIRGQNGGNLVNKKSKSMPPNLLPPPLPDVRGELVRGGVGVLDHGALLKQRPPLDGLQLVPRDGILVSVVSTANK